MGVNTLAVARARIALDAAGLNPDVALTRASSVTNEVWLTPDLVVRVNSRPDHRLRREADLARTLPLNVGYPPIIAYGGELGADWLILERVRGKALSRWWPDLSRETRRSAVAQLADKLRAVHATVIPGLGDLNEVPQLLDRAHRGIGAVARLLTALETLRALPHVHPALIDQASELVRGNAHHLDPFDVPTLVHGDLTFENILWDGERITALLDFEWARPGPPDLDLDILLRMVAYPKLHVAEDYEHRTRAEDYSDVPWWLANDYPELFEHRGQYERICVYSIAWDVKELLQFPPPCDVRHLPAEHPYHRLAGTVRGTGYLALLNGESTIRI